MVSDHALYFSVGKYPHVASGTELRQVNLQFSSRIRLLEPVRATERTSYGLLPGRSSYRHAIGP
jgi:hypothetical protein